MEGSEGQMQFIEWGGVLKYVTKAECRKQRSSLSSKSPLFEKRFLQGLKCRLLVFHTYKVGNVVVRATITNHTHWNVF